MEECVFCKIVSKKLPAFILFENESAIAFLNIRPYTKGHSLVIPKKHHRWIWDIPKEEAAQFFELCQKVAKHLQKTSGNELVYSLTVGEEVPHAHFHIIPNDAVSKFPKALDDVIDEVAFSPELHELAGVLDELIEKV
ncbi:HIT domain-containing protein [Candidatus Nomurabacteria bacterium]|nr:HIT domain-containing protein [Candidatus Nomurabacteria bacterium]